MHTLPLGIANTMFGVFICWLGVLGMYFHDSVETGDFEHGRTKLFLQCACLPLSQMALILLCTYLYSVGVLH
jgi:hypothetical protein